MLPCVAVTMFFIVQLVILYRQVTSGGYVIISGECIEVDPSAKKGRNKYLVVKTEACDLKVMLRGKPGNVKSGKHIDIYVLKKTKLYEQNSMHLLYNYIGIEVK
jgi:general stress protein CsbA